MPQPVDLQTEIARVSATEKIQEIADRASLAAQKHHSLDEEQKRVESETQVQASKETENKEINADAGGEKAERRKRRSRGGSADKKRRKKGKGGSSDAEIHSFDVTI